MTNELLHSFKEDLLKRPLPGFMAGTPSPPRVILAKDLDGNNEALTLIEGDGDPPLYRVEYTKEGTKITDISVFPEDGIAKEFDVCENGSPTSYYFVVWNEEPLIP
jgi:hypothetical protein